MVYVCDNVLMVMECGFGDIIKQRHGVGNGVISTSLFFLMLTSFLLACVTPLKDCDCDPQRVC